MNNSSKQKKIIKFKYIELDLNELSKNISSFLVGVGSIIFWISNFIISVIITIVIVKIFLLPLFSILLVKSILKLIVAIGLLVFIFYIWYISFKFLLVSLYDYGIFISGWPKYLFFIPAPIFIVVVIFIDFISGIGENIKYRILFFIYFIIGILFMLALLALFSIITII